MNEIENPSDQLDGYTDEVIAEIKRQKEKNPDLDEISIVISTLVASQNIRTDAIWRRLAGLTENLGYIADNISYLKEEE